MPTKSSDELLEELRANQSRLQTRNEELRRAQLALEESRNRYIELYEFAPVGYVTLSQAGVILEANLTSAAQFGAERKKLIGRPFGRLVAAADEARWQQQFLQFRQGIGASSCEVVIHRADASAFDAHIDSRRLVAGGLNPVVQLAITNLSAVRDRVEGELRVAAVAFEAQQSIVITDAHGTILRVNHAFTRLTGYSAGEIVGRNMNMLNSGRHDDAFYTAMWDSVHRNGMWQGEIWNKRKDGAVQPQWLTITGVRDGVDGGGAISHYVGTLTDISEQVDQREQMESRLAAYALRLNLASSQLFAVQEEARRRLSGDLHDRTKPNLAAMDVNLGVIEQLTRGGPAELAELVERLADMRALVEDTEASVRDICAELRPPVLDYAGLGATLQEYARQFSKRTGIRVAADCANGETRLEPTVESVLFRICQEALTNAAKHAGAKLITVVLNTRAQPVSLTVTDDGSGFDPEGVGKSGRMPGLGLLNMREMSTMVGGRLTIVSRPGRGTRITVQL